MHIMCVITWFDTLHFIIIAGVTTMYHDIDMLGMNELKYNSIRACFNYLVLIKVDLPSSQWLLLHIVVGC